MNYIYIGNRQVGKSTLALHKFMEDPENSILFVQNMAIARQWKSKVNDMYDIDPIDASKYKINGFTIDSGRGSSVKRLIFDEFFFFSEKLISEWWPNIFPTLARDGEVYIYSSYHPEHIERQRLFVQQLASYNWNVKYLKGGIEIEKREVTSWIFNTPEKSIKDYTPKSESTISEPRVVEFIPSKRPKQLFHDHYDRNQE